MQEYPALTEEMRRAIAEIWLWRSRFLFGLLLSFLCEKAGISQNKLGKMSEQHRRHLKASKYIYPKSITGAVDQSGISRGISAERPLSYGQVYIWLHVLKEIFESKEYKTGNDFEFTKDLEADMWRLALFGTPEEVYFAYKRHEGMINERSSEFIAAYEKHRRIMEESVEEE